MWVCSKIFQWKKFNCAQFVVDVNDDDDDENIIFTNNTFTLKKKIFFFSGCFFVYSITENNGREKKQQSLTIDNTESDFQGLQNSPPTLTRPLTRTKRRRVKYKSINNVAGLPVS